MLARNGCKVVVLCALKAAAIAVGSAQTARSNATTEAFTFNCDGAQRSNQIHWPDGYISSQDRLLDFLFSRHRHGTSILASLLARDLATPNNSFGFLCNGICAWLQTSSAPE
jgi:hypothetical protein